MRVTKTIKDYITKQVEARIPMPEDTEYRRLKKALNEATKQANEKLAEMARQMEQEIKVQLGVPEDWIDKRNIEYHPNSINFNDYNSKLYIAERAAQKEVKNRRAEAIENILVELELGGDRAKLEELLGAL